MKTLVMESAVHNDRMNPVWQREATSATPVPETPVSKGSHAIQVVLQLTPKATMVQMKVLVSGTAVLNDRMTDHLHSDTPFSVRLNQLLQCLQHL